MSFRTHAGGMTAQCGYPKRVEEVLFSQLLFGLSLYKQLGSSRPRSCQGEGTCFPRGFNGDAHARILDHLADSGPLSTAKKDVKMFFGPCGSLKRM